MLRGRGTHEIPKKVTPAKSTANKKNAEESTGPTSSAGKAIASRNAVRHGILARDMFLPGESEKEFQRLRSETINSKCPVGSGEFVQVDIKVWNVWRLRRLYRAEAGEITKVLADGTPAPETVAFNTSQYNRAVADLTKLEEIEARIDSEAQVSTEDQAWLRNLRYGEPLQHFLDVIGLAQAAEHGERARPTPGKSAGEENQEPRSDRTAATSEAEAEGEKEFARVMLLGSLEQLKNAISVEQFYHLEKLAHRVASQSNAAHVPQDAVLERLMRYESHLLRNIYRAEHELERMQRLRRGEKVP